MSSEALTQPDPQLTETLGARLDALTAAPQLSILEQAIELASGKSEADADLTASPYDDMLLKLIDLV